MVRDAEAADSQRVTASRSPFIPLPRLSSDVVDLHVRRMGGETAMARMAAAPVRHVPAALLEALQGSWGTPEELGLAACPQPHLRVIAG